MSVKFSYFFFLIFCLVGIFIHLQAAEKTKIKALVFDFGGVMTQTDHNAITQFVAQSLNISLTEAKEIFKQLKQRTALGEQELDIWLDEANFKGINLPNDWIELLNAARLQALRVVPGMPDLVQDLQKQGFQTALLSNVSRSHAQIKSQLGFYALFEPALYSYEIGVRKPDLKAYHILLEQLQLPPEEILFIDNKLANIKAAQSLGIDAIQFIDTAQLIEELKQRRIEVTVFTDLSYINK